MLSAAPLVPVHRTRRIAFVFSVAAAAQIGCNALLDIDGIAFSDTSGGGAVSTGGQDAGGGGAGDGGTVSSGGAAGHGGTAAGGAGAQGGGGGGGSICVLGPFGPPVLIDGVNSSSGEDDPSISPDERTIYFDSGRAGTLGGSDIWYASRGSGSGPFGTPQNLGTVNSAFDEEDVEIAADGLTVYFASDRTGGLGNLDLWYATRTSTGQSFGAPQNLVELSTSSLDRDPAASADGLALFFASSRPGGSGGNDIWVATRPNATAPFGTPVNVSEVNSSSGDDNPAISSDGLELYFTSGRPGGSGSYDLWVARRSAVTLPFDPPENLNVLNTTALDADPTISGDGLALYFASTRTGGIGGADIYVATRSCL